MKRKAGDPLSLYRFLFSATESRYSFSSCTVVVSQLRLAGYKYPKQHNVGARKKPNHTTHYSSNTMYPILLFYVALAAAMNSLCLLGPPVQISAGSLVSAL